MKLIRLFMMIGLLSLARPVLADEALTEGRIITLAHENVPTVLAPSTKEAEVFQLILRSDMQAMVNQKNGDDWLADALAVQKYYALLTKYTKSGLFTEIKRPTKARVTEVISSEEIVCPNLYEVEVVEGPLKGKRFGYSYDYDRGSFLHFFRPGYIYFKRNDGIVEPATLAFDPIVCRAYDHAVESGDTDMIAKLKRAGRIWTVPINSIGQIVEKDGDVVHARIEVLTGPMKGRKGWGRVWEIEKVAVPSKLTRVSQQAHTTRR